MTKGMFDPIICEDDEEVGIFTPRAAHCGIKEVVICRYQDWKGMSDYNLKVVMYSAPGCPELFLTTIDAIRWVEDG